MDFGHCGGHFEGNSYDDSYFSSELVYDLQLEDLLSFSDVESKHEEGNSKEQIIKY